MELSEHFMVLQKSRMIAAGNITTSQPFNECLDIQ